VFKAILTQAWAF